MSQQKIKIISIIISVIFLAAAFLLKTSISWLPLVLYLISYLAVGGRVIIGALRNIFRGNIFNEQFLMTIASIGAFIIGEYPEGTAVMLFYQVGELFEDYAVDRSRRSIASLMDIRPDYANLKTGETITKVDPEQVKIGDIIVIRPGEKIPLDAVVTHGSSLIDTVALTGEPVPREVLAGDAILSGCVNVNGLLYARVSKEFGESTVNKILDLVENASSKKSRSENFITRFARYYTPIVVGLAVLIALVPPLVIPAATFADWVYRALVFLVISCPCALVISVPLSFFAGIGKASRNGILIKGGNYLEALAKTETVVFDKTGTLTKGVFAVQQLHPLGISQQQLLELAAYAESYSSHPISLSLQQAYGQELDLGRISQVEELAGHGVSALIDGKQVLVGNARLMEKEQIAYEKNIAAIGTICHVALNHEYVGYIIIADQLKDDAAEAVAGLKPLGIRQTALLTGDSEAIGQQVASQLGIDKCYAGLLPGDKVDQLEQLLASKSAKAKLAYVGDGINDAPVLARADIGIAMGGLGSDAAIEAADIVIMTDEPKKIITAIKIAKKTVRIASQNIVFALGIKLIILALGALGLASMWAAVFADVGVSVIAICNAVRVLYTKKIS